MAGNEWLQAVGFSGREHWAGALLHAGRATLPGSGRISALVSAVPDVSVVEPQGEGWGVRRRLPDGRWCEMSVFLNGAHLDRQTRGGDWKLDFITWRKRIDGVEMHVGPEGPLMDRSGCGYVLIWSEEAADDERPSFRGDLGGYVQRTEDVVITGVLLEPGGERAGVGPEGTFEFLDILPGSYSVIVMGGERELARKSIRVYAHARSSVTFTVGRPGLASENVAPTALRRSRDMRRRS